MCRCVKRKTDEQNKERNETNKGPKRQLHQRTDTDTPPAPTEFTQTPAETGPTILRSTDAPITTFPKMGTTGSTIAIPPSAVTVQSGTVGTSFVTVRSCTATLSL
jgi:hypothetical protein